MSVIDESGKSIINKGKVKIFIGGSLPISRSSDLGSASWLESSFLIK